MARSLFGISPYVLIRENVGIFESMRRSKLIVKGRWWRVFGYFILFSLITIAISFAFLIPNLIIDVALRTSFPQITTIDESSIFGQPLNLKTFMIFLILSGVLKGIFSIIKLIIIFPLTILFFKNFYFNLRFEKQKGGVK